MSAPPSRFPPPPVPPPVAGGGAKAPAFPAFKAPAFPPAGSAGGAPGAPAPFPVPAPAPAPAGFKGVAPAPVRAPFPGGPPAPVAQPPMAATAVAKQPHQQQPFAPVPAPHAQPPPPPPRPQGVGAPPQPIGAPVGAPPIAPPIAPPVAPPVAPPQKQALPPPQPHQHHAQHAAHHQQHHTQHHQQHHAHHAQHHTQHHAHHHHAEHAPPRQQQHAAPPPQQQHAAPPPQQQHAAPPQQQQQQQQQHAPPPQQRAMMRSNEEAANIHTMVLERGSTKSTRLMRHPSITRSADQEAIRGVPRQHSRFASASARAVENECVQLTSTAMPNTPAAADKFAMPIGVSVRPLAPCYAHRAPPVVHFQEIDQSIQMVRCSVCRSYINPFVTFTAADRYACSVCRRANAVPVAYQCEIDRQTGQRRDLADRPELVNAVCDIVAPQDYVPSAPKRPTMLFLLDVSYQAVSSGMLAAACQGIANGLANGALSEDYQVAFVAFDSNVYLFHLAPELESPKMVVAPDVVSDVLQFTEKGEIQQPLELPSLLDDLYCCPVDSKDLIASLMSRLPSIFAQSNASESAFGPALNVAMSMLAGPGGKVLAFVGSCPVTGEGKLAPRGIAKDAPDVQPANDFYKQRAIACTAHQISVDLFVSGVTDVDLATLAPIARYTSGHITRFTPFTLNGLARDVEHALSREYGFDAVLRIRTPTNVTLKNFYGHFYVRGPDLLALPVCDSDAVYSFEVAPTTNLTHSPVFIQIALMYTTKQRERRLRVMTFGIEATGDLNRIYNRACAPVMASFAAKMLVDQCIGNTFARAAQVIADRFAASLKTFRAITASARSGGAGAMNQLVLPTSLAGLPLLLAGLFRSTSVRPSAAAGAGTAADQLRSDERVGAGAALVFAVLDAFLSHVVPTCYCVWDPTAPAEELPRSELCSVESFRPECMYMLDAGSQMFCWIGKSVPADVPAAFGFVQAPRANQHPSTVGTSSPSQDPGVIACANAAGELYAARQGLTSTFKHWASIVVLNQDGSVQYQTGHTQTSVFPDAVIANATERVLYPLLIEDEMPDSMSYGALLIQLAKKSAEP